MAKVEDVLGAAKDKFEKLDKEVEAGEWPEASRPRIKAKFDNLVRLQAKVLVARAAEDIPQHLAYKIIELSDDIKKKKHPVMSANKLDSILQGLLGRR